MRLGRPCKDKENCPNGCNSKQTSESCVPSLMFDQRSETHARKQCAEIAEKPGQTNGRCGGAFGGEVCGSDSYKTLRTVNKETHRAEQGGIEKRRIAGHFPERED